MTAKFFMALSHTETAAEVPDESIKTGGEKEWGKRQRQVKKTVF